MPVRVAGRCRRRTAAVLHSSESVIPRARRHDQAVVKAGEFDGLPLPADEVDGREMKRVEGAHEGGEGCNARARTGGGNSTSRALRISIRIAPLSVEPRRRA